MDGWSSLGPLDSAEKIARRTDPMARIPDSELERLKREVSVERLAEARGVQLERRGADLHGLCPFHEDREPSKAMVTATACRPMHQAG
jgi:hypothetical protein